VWFVDQQECANYLVSFSAEGRLVLPLEINKNNNKVHFNLFGEK
jgi:hypothetical protein